MESMSERLKSLGFKKAVSIPPSTAKSDVKLESAVDGKVIRNSLGEFVLKETLYPMNHQHGVVTFHNDFQTETIHRTAKITPESPSLERLLFIDTETSGLSGGTGTFAFLVGYGRFSSEGFLLTQLMIRDPGEEPAMLLHLINQINDKDIFVSFNGKSFDIPLLQNRLVLNRLAVKLREFQHMDMLHISRKLWKYSLESCSLKTIENAILKFTRTSDDVPGWMIPDIYFAFLRTGDPSGLKEVVYHNAQDIISLAALFIHVSKLLAGSLSPSCVPVDDLIAISRIYWDLGSYEVSQKILNSLLPRTKTTEQRIVINASLGRIFKKIGRSNEAVRYWQEAAENGDAAACIELATYYEHSTKDCSTALQWCEKGLQAAKNGEKGSANSRYLINIQKRMTRLQFKRSNHV
jgi:hypothetical protein